MHIQTHTQRADVLFGPAVCISVCQYEFFVCGCGWFGTLQTQVLKAFGILWHINWLKCKIYATKRQSQTIFESSCTFDMPYRKMVERCDIGNWKWEGVRSRSTSQVGGIQNQQNGKFQFQSAFVCGNKKKKEAVSGHGWFLSFNRCMQKRDRMKKIAWIDIAHPLKWSKKICKCHAFNQWGYVCLCVSACNRVPLKIL